MVFYLAFWTGVSLALLAQVDPSGGLAGSSGWAGAGLLGLVLAWLLLLHLPRKDAQAQAMSDTRDKQIGDILRASTEQLEKERSARHMQSDSFRTAMQQATEMFQAVLKDERQVCEQRCAEIDKRHREWLADSDRRYAERMAEHEKRYAELVQTLRETREMREGRETREGREGRAK